MQAGALLDVTLSNGETIQLPALPVEFDGEKTALYQPVPAPGQGAEQHLEALGIDAARLRDLVAADIVKAC